EKPDILCVQEVKASKEEANIELDGYNILWNAAEKKGYSGTAIFSREELKQIETDLDDDEGRVLVAEHTDFFLINTYSPNSQRGLTRLDHRLVWEDKFKDFIVGLKEKKPVIICGDLNVAHNEIDIARPDNNRKNAGFTDGERRKFTELLESGFIDTFRFKHPEKVKYSWWSYMFNARAKNIGWRLDYFCVSSDWKEKIKRADILTEVEGSDHCPIILEI
ncbi:MAG: exodeoxyribonuclease III, partial [Nanoarchaeota archaeon]